MVAETNQVRLFSMTVRRLAAHHFRRSGLLASRRSSASERCRRLDHRLRAKARDARIRLCDARYRHARQRTREPHRHSQATAVELCDVHRFHGEPLTAEFEAFKKLSDPSHRRCLGLIEWEQVLAGAGFDIAHREHLDKEMEFGPWVERMRSNTHTTARLKEMLLTEPLRSFVASRDTGSGLAFTLKEGMVTGKKPR